MYKVEPNKFRAFRSVDLKNTKTEKISRYTTRMERISKKAKDVYYVTKTGVNRMRTLHPTKGWRDRNMDSISQSMTGVKANEFKLVAKDE